MKDIIRTFERLNSYLAAILRHHFKTALLRNTPWGWLSETLYTLDFKKKTSGWSVAHSFRLIRKSSAAVTARTLALTRATSLKRRLIVFDNRRLTRLHSLTPPLPWRSSASCHYLRPFPLFEAARYLWQRKSAALALISHSCVARLHVFSLYCLLEGPRDQSARKHLTLRAVRPPCAAQTQRETIRVLCVRPRWQQSV